MPDPTTTNLGLFIPLNGADIGTWDVPMNANFNLLDKIFGATTSVALTNVPVTLSAAQYQCVLITFTGALTGNVTVTFPAVGRSYLVNNTTSGAFTVTLKCGGGSTITVTQGTSPVLVVADGTNMFLVSTRRRGLFHVTRGGVNQTGLTGNTYNKIQFNTKVYDDEVWFNTATFRYTPLLAGIYQVTVSVLVTYTTETNASQAAIYKNGAVAALGTFINSNSNTASSQVTGIITCNGSTDFIEGWAFVPTTNPGIQGAVESTYMFGYRLPD